MSDTARSVSEALERFSRRDPTLKVISLISKRLTDAELGELVDCLLAHPDVVTRLWLGSNQLTDETGIKLARFVAASSTIQTLSMSNNKLGSGTYLALAAALRVNSSLRVFYLFGNQAADRTRIDAVFVEALRLNPDRPVGSTWQLYSWSYLDVDLKRLQAATFELGHPSLQLLLAARLTDDRPTATLL